MGRVDGVVFDVAVFLNLGRDHLDFHADVEDYFEAKASLFTPERARLALVNVDDEHGRRLAERGDAAGAHVLRPAGGDADWRADRTSSRRRPGSTFLVARARAAYASRPACPLPGDFNVANALAAVAALRRGRARRRRRRRGRSPPAAACPGRLERVDAGQDFTVVVDYAHKPDAVAAALASLRPLTDGRLIVVLGAGGDRDPGKRPIMGEIAARLADVARRDRRQPAHRGPRRDPGRGARRRPRRHRPR